MPVAVEPVHLAGYDLYVAKNSYVDRKMLDRPYMRDVIVNRIQPVLENPYFHRAHQTSTLRRFKRFRLLDSWRLYLRIHEDRQVAVITALLPKEDIGKGIGGGIQQAFVDAMVQHEKFDFSLIEALQPLESTTTPEAETDHWYTFRPKYTIGIEEIDAGHAKALLACLVRPGPSIMFTDVLEQVRRDHSRILVDPKASGLAQTDDDVRKVQAGLALFLRKHREPWTVRYDWMTGKLLVVPNDKVGLYCMESKGRKPR